MHSFYLSSPAPPGGFKLPHVAAPKDQIFTCTHLDVRQRTLHEHGRHPRRRSLPAEAFCDSALSCLFSEVCSVDCGTHGVCMGGACRCEEGWTGAGCDQRVCNPLCIKHGTCKDGKCQCHQGWNGEHCTIGQHHSVSVCARASVSDVCLLINSAECAEAPGETSVTATLHFTQGI